jgi:hypothetical protein
MGPLSQAGLGPRPISRRTALSYSRDVDSLSIIRQRNEKKKIQKQNGITISIQPMAHIH